MKFYIYDTSIIAALLRVPLTSLHFKTQINLLTYIDFQEFDTI